MRILFTILVCSLFVNTLNSQTLASGSSTTIKAIVSVTDSLRIYNAGYAAGYAAKVCPPLGFTQAQLDSAYRAGMAKFPDSLSLGGQFWTPAKTYIPKP